MPLAIPNIGSLFSVWTKSLRVTGALPGATITVRSIGSVPRDIASGIARGGSDWIGLLPNASIMTDDGLVVRQQLAGEASNWTPDAKAYVVTPVPASPTDFRPVEIRSRLWECGEYIWLKGAEPGAGVEFSYGSVNPATADAPDGTARLRLAGKLTKANPVTVRQVTPIGTSLPSNTTTANVQALPVPQSVQLPPPTLRGRPRACEMAVVVQDVFDGATVTLKRTSGPSESAGFDLSALIFGLHRPFVQGEYVSAVQTMTKCERSGAESGAVQVGPPEALQPGVGPLCVGGPGVRVYNLQPGAIIHFDVNGTRYDLMAPPEETSYSFDFDPPLPAGTATVTQEICGVVSPPTVVPIEHRPAIASKPMLRKPLYDCARSVTVENVCVGAEVQLFAETPTGVGPISARKVCLSDIDDFDVTPHLKVNTFIWAVEIGCEQSSMRSDHEIVAPHPPIDPPEIEEPVEGGATVVTVKGVIPTASVCVSLLEKDLWIPIGYKPYAEAPTTTVPLDRAVKTKDQLAATQTYCGLTTKNGPTITVVKPKPLAPVIKMPAPGSTNVAYQSLTVSWADPGAGTDRAADLFDLEIRDVSGLVTSLYALKTTSSPVSNLKVGTVHTIKVRGSNSTGFGPWGTGTFTTRAPKPNLTKFDPPTLSGDNFPPNADVTLHVTLEIKGTLYLKEGVPVKYDIRVKDLLGFAADGTGKLTQSVDLVALLDPYTFLAPSGGPVPLTVRCAGPLKGEWIHISASYNTPSLGKIVSNVLDYQWTKDTQFITLNG